MSILVQQIVAHSISINYHFICICICINYCMVSTARVQIKFTKNIRIVSGCHNCQNLASKLCCRYFIPLTNIFLIIFIRPNRVCSIRLYERDHFFVVGVIMILNCTVIQRIVVRWCSHFIVVRMWLPDWWAE